MVLTIPYIVPLFLGMTFDARTYSPGVSIFEDSAVDNPQIVPMGRGVGRYAIVSQNSEIRNALDISGDLALKIKTGNIEVKGSGSYIKNEEDIQNSVIILCTFKYTSRVVSLGNANPRKGWLNDFSKGVLGTHYVNEIIYGVEMVASLKFTASNSSDKEEIKAKIEGSLSAGKGDAVELTAEGNLEKIVNKTKDKSQLEISYFGTLPLRSVPNTIEGLKDLIKNFSTHVKEAGLDRTGLPMGVNLKELATLDGAEGVKEFQYRVNEATRIRFERFQDAYLKLSEARSKLFSWSRSLPFDLSVGSSRKIGELMQELNDDMNFCYALISTVDLTADPSTLNGDKNITAKSYLSKVRRTIKEVEKEVAINSQVTTDSYIHYGNSSCPGSENGEAVKLFDGYTVGSTKEGIGGVAKYDCMPISTTGNTYPLRDIGHQSLITGITFGNISRSSNPFNGTAARYVSTAVVPCAKCHQLDASTVSVFSATTKCPASWDLKYSGYLMSGGTNDAHTTQYICVDDHPSDPRRLPVDDLQNSVALTVVRSGGSLPQTYVNDQLVPCVVCSLKGGRLL